MCFQGQFKICLSAIKATATTTIQYYTTYQVYTIFACKNDYILAMKKFIHCAISHLPSLLLSALEVETEKVKSEAANDKYTLIKQSTILKINFMIPRPLYSNIAVKASTDLVIMYGHHYLIL